MDNHDTKEVIQKLGIDAQVIINILKVAQPGDIITYESLSNAIGSTVNGSSGALYTARNRLLRDMDIVFGTIRGEGLKRLSESEKIGVAQSRVEQVRRVTGRGLLVARSINPDSLDHKDIPRLNLAVSHLGILAFASTAKAGKKIEGKIMSNNGLVPPAVGLEILK